ncbi:MAG: elongation factor P [Deltaproteobacteria bacterium]|nr:elongation factor P [Deltaproteobacteria bacterium]
MQMDVSELRKGQKVVIDGAPWVVLEYNFVKPGKGQALYKCRMKNMMTGSQVDRTYRSGEKFERADMEEHRMQYLYADGEGHHFMNNESFEQVMLTPEQAGDAVHFLYENLDVDMLFFNGQPIGLTLPNFVVLKIEQSDPGIKGDTASGTMKPATLSTGYTLQVPLFVGEGEWIRIDTRDGSYVERVKK